MYTPEAKQTLSEQTSKNIHPLANRMATSPTSPLVAQVNPADPGDVTWVGLNTQKGSSIVRQSARQCPDGAAAVPCMPDN